MLSFKRHHLVSLLFICCALSGVARASQWLAYGEGAKFKSVVWYHFPKTGGTTMRGIVHKFCEKRGFNMTGNYMGDTPFGRKTNLETRHAGSTPHFIYGHSETDFAKYANRKIETSAGGITGSSTSSGSSGSRDRDRDVLYVFMVRSPLPWMVSRYQHHRRKAENSQTSFVQSVTSFGREYFQFLDPVHRNLSAAWFDRSIQSELTASINSNGNNIGSSNDNANRNSFSSISGLTGEQYLATPAGITSNLENILFHQASKKSGGGNVVVLVQDHYTESLEMLDYVFGTNHFTSSSSYRHNTARESQDKGVSFGTAEELTTVTRLLEMHQALYHMCLKYFMRHLEAMRTT